MERTRMISIYIPEELYNKLVENKKRKGKTIREQVIEALEIYFKLLG